MLSLKGGCFLAVIFEQLVRRRILCIKIYLSQNVLFALAIGVRSFIGMNMTAMFVDVDALIVGTKYPRRRGD